jgi:hypothetical protein
MLLDGNGPLSLRVQQRIVLDRTCLCSSHRVHLFSAAAAFLPFPREMASILLLRQHHMLSNMYLAASVMLRPSNLHTPVVRSAACTSNRSCPLYPDDGQSFIESHKKSENLLKRQFGTLVSCGASLQSWAKEACVNLSKKI